VTPATKNLLQRLGTAAVLLPPIVWLFFVGGWPLAVLFAVATAMATFEFFRLTVGPLSLHTAVPLALATALPLLPHLAPAQAPGLALALLVAANVWGWGSWVLQGDIEHGAQHAPMIGQGVVFCALGPFALASLREVTGGEAWVLLVVAATFGNDAFAYFGGRALGKHKLAPHVSPGKSWEGFFFGALGSAVAGVLGHVLFPATLRWADALAVALISATLGPVGDLMKSLIKRSRQVKDAGHALPGHGGMLDRIDALVVNAPAVWAWVTWLR
jgi:phosphatidate cytidylyltransferase